MHLGKFRGLASLFLLWGALWFSNPGLNSVLAAVNLPRVEPVWGFGVADAFPGLVFDQPVAIVTPPGETNRLFIAEKGGRIMVIPDLRAPRAQVFLDLTGSTEARGTEAGLLGLAFHPHYAANGRFFVYRTAITNGFRNLLAEFSVNPGDPNLALPHSEKALISQLDASDTHNAGDVKFGPDGYLYFSNGDEAPEGEDVHQQPQAIDRGLFAGIFRIDVDFRPGNLAPNPHPSSSAHYRIPQDNPFVGATEFLGQLVDPARVRTEFFAVGLRNPWRFSFDPATGQLLCADVGSGVFEEINLIEKGGNYGWPYLEAAFQHFADPPEGLSLPIHSYGRGYNAHEGRVIIGGLVHSGQSLPGLEGRYLYADFESGNLWALDWHSGGAPLWLTYARYTSSFGQDPRDGGVLLANLISGSIQKLIYRDPALSGIPTRLSEVGAFTDLQTLSAKPEFHPFEVNAPLWSDGADKSRWVSLAGATGLIQAGPRGGWVYPPGAVWVKHFELELTNGVPESRRRLETRFLVKTTNSLYGLTYRWGTSNTDAELVPPGGLLEEIPIHDGGVVRTQVWSYPGWGQCQICHNPQAGSVLGFTPTQLNRPSPHAAGGNQLESFRQKGFFAEPELVRPELTSAMASLDDERAPLQHRIRSYLASNCAHCHRPGGSADRNWDAQLSTPFHLAQILDTPPKHDTAPLMIVATRDLTNSFLFERAAVRNVYQMPPLATSLADTQFLEALTNWIGSLPTREWSSTNFGAALAEGSAAMEGRTIRVSSAGTGLGDHSFFLLHRPVTHSLIFAAKLAELHYANGANGASGAAEGGLMLTDGETFASLSVRPGGGVLFRLRAPDGSEQAIQSTTAASSNLWLRFLRDSSGLSAWISVEGEVWVPVGAAAIDLPVTLSAGFWAASGQPGAFATALFEDYHIASAGPFQPQPSQAVLPAAIQLVANTSLIPPDKSGQVSLLVNHVWAGKAPIPSGSLAWIPTQPGTHRVEAVFETTWGSVTSAPVSIPIEAPATQVWLGDFDERSRGDWRVEYGLEASLIPGFATNIFGAIAIEVVQGEIESFGLVTDPDGLATPAGRFASQYLGQPDIELRLRAADYRVHAAALYFKDWLEGVPAQTVTFSPLDETGPAQVLALPATRAGTYLKFAFRNGVRIKISNRHGTAGLAGVFVDPVEPLSVTLLEPAPNAVFQQPAAIPFAVEASAPGRGISLVRILDGTETVASFTQPPFAALLTNILAGEHQFRAVAVGTYGLGGESASTKVTVLPPAAKAEFLGADAHTQGQWPSQFGTQGYWIFGEPPNLPKHFVLSPRSGQNFFYFGEEASAQPSALQLPAREGRMAACYFSSGTLSFDFELLDGLPHQAALYFLDPQDFRGLTVRWRDPGSGQVLDERPLEDFAEGRYLLFSLRGQVRLEIEARTGNAVLSGIFLDPLPSTYTRWKNAHFPAGELAGRVVDFDADDPDHDGLSNLFEYLLDLDPLSPDSAIPISFQIRGGRYDYRVVQRTPRDDLRFAFEKSENLRDWHRVTEGVSILLRPNGGREFFLSGRVSSQARGYFRLVATR